MMNNHLVSLSIDWYPDASNDIISAFHVQLKPDAEPNTVNAVWQKYYPNMIFYWGFSNIPNNYLFFTWTPTAKELRDLRESLENEPTLQRRCRQISFTQDTFSQPGWMTSRKPAQVLFFNQP